MEESSHEDFREESYALQSDQSKRIIQAFHDAFEFTVEGGIDWTLKPYSKKWYWSRHGAKSMQHMLMELIGDGRVLAFIHRSDTDTVLNMPAQEAAKIVFTLLHSGTFLWIFPVNGRWIIEFSNDNYLHFDYCIPDEMNLVPVFGSCPF